MLLPLVLLSGCAITAVPVAPSFPDAPATLQEKCAALKEVAEDASLTDFTKIVVENYILYHECSRKVDGWQEWYTKQKAIFEEATKK
jgi:hypothetical protein